MGRSRGRNVRPTIIDVAREAGVSPATAARALGGYGPVSPATRRRVDAAAAALGYRANTLARSMVTGSTQTIGVVVADIENTFFARAVRGITDFAHAAGLEVVLANSDEDVAKERAAVAILLEKRVDGLIVAPASNIEVDHLAGAVRHGCPLVLFDRAVDGVEADAIIVNSRRAAHQAVAHLTGLGHRRIALISESAMATSETPSRSVNPTTERFFGYASALRAAGLPVSSELVRQCRYDRASAAEQTLLALRVEDPATAVFTTDGVMTLGAMDAILAGRRRIPEEISLVAFDDLEWTTIVQPPLTVVAQPVYELGTTAVSRLIDRLDGDERPPDVITLETTFIPRGSTGPPPN
jgi:LacI family transcriptional regulator